MGDYVKGMINIDDVANRAADAAIRRYKEKEKEEARKKRFHNTDLLLKNYNSLVDHINKSKDSIDDIETFDFERLKSDDEFIQSIRRSRIRTAIMVEDINTQIEVLKKKMVAKGQEEKYKTIELIYFQGKTYEETAELLNCGVATVHRWKNEMVKELGLLLFGVDGLKMEL